MGMTFFYHIGLFPILIFVSVFLLISFFERKQSWVGKEVGGGRSMVRVFFMKKILIKKDLNKLKIKVNSLQ